MPSALPLDSRQARIARALLDGDGVLNLERIAGDVGLTQRVVRYNLPSVEAYLGAHGLRLEKRRGVGLRLTGDPGSRLDARTDLETSRGPAILDADDRQARVVLALLDAAPDAVRSEALEASLGVSRPTVRRDIRASEVWFEQHRLHLRRLPGVGIAVRGSELEVRAALLALILESVPERALLSASSGQLAARGAVPSGLAAYLADLDLPATRAILAAELGDVDEEEATIVAATVGVAILVRRVRAGRPARLARGRLRSLVDHPIHDAGRRIATALDRQEGVELPAAEVAAITESLLGLVELSDPRATADDQLVALVDRLVAAAAARLHPSLADDELLRTSLAEHVRRLDVRLRYGMPVSNPLQQEVRKRYPDVFRVATDIVADLGSVEGAPIPAEEVGYLTMYLAGSLERHRLRTKVQVTVVCPAGMATAWILVSRLLAEFPQLEVAQVISKAAFEAEAAAVATDLVVSTVPIEGLRVPSLVVSPLLAERDVRRLTRLLELPLGR